MKRKKILIVLGEEVLSKRVLQRLSVLKFIFKGHVVEVSSPLHTNNIKDAVTEYVKNNNLIYITGKFDTDTYMFFANTIPEELDINNHISSGMSCMQEHLVTQLNTAFNGNTACKLSNTNLSVYCDGLVDSELPDILEEYGLNICNEYTESVDVVLQGYTYEDIPKYTQHTLVVHTEYTDIHPDNPLTHSNPTGWMHTTYQFYTGVRRELRKRIENLD